jgi:hypothetical protein
MLAHKLSLLAGAVFLVATAAHAEMAPPSYSGSSSDLRTVADGCGYGYHRTASGRCDNVRDYNAWCQKGFHKVPTPTTPSGFRCVQNGY